MVLVAALNGCSRQEQAVRFFRSDAYTFSAAEQRQIETIFLSTLREVKPLLPGLPDRIQLTVRPGNDVIDHTGETGTAMPPDALMWTVDPTRDGGVSAIARRWLRASIIHELHHLARSAAQPPKTLMDHAIYEGMATVFERDFAGAKPPWGEYPDHVAEWTNELLRLPPESPAGPWLYQHPDGRRWIGMKAGTYLVDEAMKKSQRSIQDLTTASTPEIISLSGIEPSS